MKKFYKSVNIRQDNSKYFIELDGKSIKTPSGSTLYADNIDTANQSMNEWANQEDDIDPQTMPVTQILITCIDRVRKDREDMHDLLLAYLDTDLLCYRAAEPPEMRKAQEKEWDQWVKWFEEKYKTELKTTFSIIAIKQPKDVKEELCKEVKNLSDIEFTILQLVTSMSGSIIMGMAFLHRSASCEAVYNAAHAEENLKAEIYNEEFYGKSPTQEKKQNSMTRDLNAAHVIICSL